MAHILLIDDDPQIIQMLATCLKGNGYLVTTTSDGSTGIHLLQEYHFDLVITDIVMPNTDGFEVILSLLTQPQRPKIIVMSGGSLNLSHGFLLETAQKLKADRVLAKPVGIKELLTVIHEVTQTT
jgi:CheY-like chemotaxis protein